MMDEHLVNDQTPLLFDKDSENEQHQVVRGNVLMDPLQSNDDTHYEFLAVFVISFDTRSGNVIEWYYPNNVDINGIEFKAIISGAHKVKTDFVYFMKNDFYGLSCFENMPVQSNLERGARMKSVGILSTSYVHLFKHIYFLQSQVRKLLVSPGSYDQLVKFFDDKSKITINPDNTLSPHDSPDYQDSKSSSDQFIFDDSTSFDSYMAFINFFGVKVFALWKLVLLQKRILFFSPPPIGAVCYRVYCASTLASHQVPQVKKELNPPLFNVNLNDMNVLERKSSFIACTSEKVFERKNTLYDVYIDNQNFCFHSKALKHLCRTSSSDSAKYNNLKNRAATSSSSVGNMFQANSFFKNYFSDLNNRLFDLLLDISISNDRQMTSEHIRSLGLDPKVDRYFLLELIELYGYDVILVADEPCCPM